MRYLPGQPHQLPGNRQQLSDYQAKHFHFEVAAGVATVTLNRPERKNPLTFDSYAELRDLFRAMSYADDVKAVVVTGAGDNFCSGGDVHDIIGPLTKLDMPGLLAFTRMTGDLVKAMRACPQPIVAAIDGICAGAGALLTVMMWSAVLPPDSNPFMDDHLVYAAVLPVLALLGAGMTLGFGRVWAATPLVRRATWLT